MLNIYLSWQSFLYGTGESCYHFDTFQGGICSLESQSICLFSKYHELIYHTIYLCFLMVLAWVVTDLALTRKHMYFRVCYGCTYNMPLSNYKWQMALSVKNFYLNDGKIKNYLSWHWENSSLHYLRSQAINVSP